MAMNETIFAELLLADYLPKLNISGLGAAEATQQAKDLCDSIATVITYIQTNAEVATVVSTTVAASIPVTTAVVGGVGTGVTTAPGAGTGTGTGAAGSAVL